MEIKDRQLTLTSLRIDGEGFEARASGGIELAAGYRHQLQLALSGLLPSGDELRGKGTLRGDVNESAIDQHLQQPSDIRVTGVFRDLLQQPAWHADVTIDDFDAGHWRYPLPEIAGSARFSASGDLQSAALTGDAKTMRSDTGPVVATYKLAWSGDDKIDIQSLQLHATQSATTVTASGHWIPGAPGGSIALELAWSNLRWPLRGKPWFDSENGHGRIAGKPTDYRFEIHTDRPWDFLPESTWLAKGSGDFEGVVFDRLDIETLDGRISANGRIGWMEGFNWQATAQASGINPRGLHADWTGALDFTIVSEGRLQHDGIAGDITVREMQGILRGYPVSLSSEMAWRNGGINITRLDFRSAGSSLTASGRVDRQLDIEWSLDSAEIAELLPRSGGRLKASGGLAGPRDQPVLSAMIAGESLSYREYRASRINGTLNLDLLNPEHLTADLRASYLSFGEFQIDHLEVVGNARDITLKAEAGDYQADIHLAGSARQQEWQGELRRADLNLGRLKKWQLQQPLKLNLASLNMTLERGCWTGDEQALFCGDVQSQQGAWTANLMLTAFPMQALAYWLPANMNLAATADGTAQLSFRDRQLRGTASVDLPAGKLHYTQPDGDRHELSFQQGRAQLLLAAEGVQVSAELQQSDSTKITAKLELPGARLPGFDAHRQRLQGGISINLDDLAFAGAWLPEIDELKGGMNALVNVSGTLSSPELNGRLTLSDGSFTIPRLGLQVTQVSLTGRSSGLQRFDYSLSAQSGDGSISVRGAIERDDKNPWISRMTLHGRDLEIARIPEAQAIASMDLTIRIKPYQLELEGDVTIPYAHLEPRDYSSAVRVSDDVIIIGDQSVEDRRWKIVSHVRILLGDRVHFFGYGFEGRLGGQLLIEEDSGLPTRANGEITVSDGRYRAYGQRLEVEQGHLIFSGGPLITPGLDIRALRRIGTITVGIHALGTLAEPKIELFSTPAMSQTDILSYLLLGRPLETASSEEGRMMSKAALALGLSGGDRIARNLRDRFGLDEMRLDSNDSGDQASLVIGRYLSPRLYISYGIGLIEAFNTFIVRYQISDHWQLKAQSGESHGADLIYSIER
jgi:translocation and assembly module TamB